jgi:putative SOS response-associated peptidase YedK
LSFEACYNVAPTSPVPAVWPTAGGGLQLGLLRWGLIPVWWKQEKPPSLTFNARSEEAAQKPVWRDSFRQGRCLIPALGWYEWQTVERTNPETGRTIKAKEPFCLHRPADPLLAFAGLKAQWRSPGGELVSSCAILTRAASPQLSFLHHRMPVVLPKELHVPWLSSQTDPKAVGGLLGSALTDMAYYRVGEAVNCVGVNEPFLNHDKHCQQF